MNIVQGGVCAAKGFLAAGIHCGIRKNKNKKDLALIFSRRPAAAAAVYTQNLVKGAPLAVTKANLADGKAQAVICNSGIANTCNADGREKAQKMCALAAKALNISPQDVVVASTGVIGQPLPLEPMEPVEPVEPLETMQPRSSLSPEKEEVSSVEQTIESDGIPFLEDSIG